MGKKGLILRMIIFAFFILWFSDFLPQQMVKVVACNYLSHQENGGQYQLRGVEYSPAHDCYFAYFDKAHGKDEFRNIGVYYRYLPVYVYFDSDYPG